MTDSSSTADDPRAKAIASLKAKRSFQISLAAYVLVNAALVLVWATTKDDGDGFWPIWTIGFWGIGLVVQGWHAYGPRWGELSEAQIEKEMQRQQGA